jgi:hypothetical protein
MLVVRPAFERNFKTSTLIMKAACSHETVRILHVASVQRGIDMVALKTNSALTMNTYFIFG